MKKFLLLLFLTICVYAQNKDAMELVFNIPHTHRTVALPLYDTVDVYVDWGDSSGESVTSIGLLEHDYDTEGMYTVSITGKLTHFGNSSSNNMDFLEKVTSWGNLGLTSLSYAFNRTTNLVSVPDSLPAGVTDISWMFYYADSFNCDISNWDLSNVTEMEGLFAWADCFNWDIGNWDVSNITDMDQVFWGAQSFDQDLSNWDVSNVTSMEYMFLRASNFDMDLGNWDVSSVTNMRGMFYLATSYTGKGLSSWDVSSVTNMEKTFVASAFSEDIGSWDVSSVKKMGYLFDQAYNFDSDISDWDVSNVTDMIFMFYGLTLSTENYSNMLMKWSKLKLQDNVTFDGGNSKYSVAGEAARQIIIDSCGWSITDGGEGRSLTYFNAGIVANEDTIGLNWGLGTDGTGYVFEIQRAYIMPVVNAAWTVVDTITGDSSADYSYRDYYPVSSYEGDGLYYRLKIIFDGTGREFSDTLNSLITGISDDNETVPAEFSLSQNYPNPFNPTTTIEYQVPESGNVSIKVYDLLAREIATLVNGTKAQGSYSVEFDASRLASGVYIYRMTAGDYVAVKKLVLLK